MQVAQNPDRLLNLRDDPASIAPERAIVFEVAGSLKDFYAQARRLGLEYLGDFEDEFEPSDDFHDRRRREALVGGRVYLAMPDVQALQELLRLFARYREDPRMPRGTGAWGDLFSRLIDLRPWGPQDRVPRETIAFWRGVLAANPDASVRFEIELWFYEQPERRARAEQRLEQEIATVGGVIVDRAVVPEIRYHAALVDVPAAQVQAIIDQPDVTLARVDEIMFLQPQSVAEHRFREEVAGADGDAPPAEAGLEARTPIAALLDGLPIQNHVRLANRLTVDDPDDLASVDTQNRP
jgi:hypothetical protein